VPLTSNAKLHNRPRSPLFTASPTPTFALRIKRYRHKRHLIKEGNLSDGRLPPILPIVLYNGQPAWNAPRDAADCFHAPPDGLEAYRPSLRYLLLDERRLQQHPEQEVRNFADAVFRMEGSRNLEDAVAVIRALDEVPAFCGFFVSQNTLPTVDQMDSHLL
jgi:hypothetical protein